jgi:hypothetical protein
LIRLAAEAGEASVMTRDEAEREAERLSREHPSARATAGFAREVGGVWSVVRVSLPYARSTDALRATVEAKPRPPQPDDPLPRTSREVGGAW